MTDHKDKQLVQHVFDVSLSGIQDDPWMAQRVLTAAHGKGEVKMKRKLSAGLILTMVLTLAAVTALALGIAFSTMTSRLAEMDAQGQFVVWNLDAKHAFVSAMRDSGYDMSEDDWAILADEAESAEDRNAAADRIIFARYGAVMEERNAQRPVPAESVIGDAPDAVDVFRERFLAENPDADHYDYLDALGYWMRDEYLPLLEAALTPADPSAPIDVTLTEDGALDDLRSYMSEIIGLPFSLIDKATVSCKQDAETGAWFVCADFADADIAAYAEDAEDVSETGFFAKTQAGYRCSFYVTRMENGDWVRSATLDSLHEDLAWTQRMIDQHTIYIDDAEDLALAAVQQQYGLTASETAKYFVYDADTYTSDPECVRVGVLLRTRNNAGAPWDYAVIVNLTTAKAEDVFTPDDLIARLPLLAAHWEELTAAGQQLDYIRWYSTWSPFGMFYEWPLEYQAAMAEALYPASEQERLQLDDPDDYHLLKEFANHRYAIPGDDELNEEEAFARAAELAGEKFGVSADVFERDSARRTFSRDEGEEPVWRWLLFNKDSSADPYRAFVWLNGVTGEAILVEENLPGAWYDAF